MLDVPIDRLLQAAKALVERAKRAPAAASGVQPHELQLSTKTKAMQMVGRSSQQQLQVSTTPGVKQGCTPLLLRSVRAL
jgi:hypothetical protein